MLVVIEDYFREKQVNVIEFQTLLELYNKRAQSLMIERIRPNDLSDMIEILINFSILTREVKKGKKIISLSVELSELTEALSAI